MSAFVGSPLASVPDTQEPPRSPRATPWRHFRHWGASQFFPLAVAGVAALLAVAPLASLAVIALRGDAEIWPHIAAYVLPVALRQTALLLAGVAVVTTVIGVGTAWIVSTFDFPGRRTLGWLLPLPLAIPTYISAYVYADVFDPLGLAQGLLHAVTGGPGADRWLPEIRSIGGAIFVFGIVLYPYVYLSVRAMLRTQCAIFVDAARLLGAPPWRLACHITLPLARPAIAIGLSLALLETLNDVGASEYFGVQTLTLSVFTTWLNRGSLPGAAQLAWIMLLGVAVLIWLERYGRRHRSYAGSAQAMDSASRVGLRGLSAWLAAAACLLPVLLGFLLPLGYLAYQVALRGLLTNFDTNLLRHVVTTVSLSAAATALALLIGFVAVSASRWTASALARVCVNVAGIGYAIPGAVLALGLLSPLVLVDEGINALTRSLAGLNVGLLLAGSSFAVIIAYVVRFLAIPIGFAQAGFARIPMAFDNAARILGAKPRVVMRLVHLPLARPAIWGAALLVFVDCMKELPATLLLRPLNVETLSTYLYQYATRGNFEQGALAALLIVLVSVIPVIRMAEFSDRALIKP